MSKIRIRVGDIEIEFEGSEEFIKEQIPELLQEIADMKALFIVEEEAEEMPPEEHQKFVDFSVATIAEKINAKTGKELVVAAAAYLTFVENAPSFSRREILDAMKAASHHYQKNYSKNLSRYLQQLLREKVLNQTASGTYAFSAAARKELEQKIVG